LMRPRALVQFTGLPISQRPDDALKAVRWLGS
jgi:hypothetical protein